MAALNLVSDTILLFNGYQTAHERRRRRYSRVVRSRSALPMTLTDESAIAAAAIIGDSSNPKVG